MFKYTDQELLCFDSRYDHKHNYCGPEGSFSFPRTLLLIDCNYEYFLHDVGYARGGSSEGRALCDRVMYEGLKRRIRSKCRSWNPLRYIGYRMARNRYLAVRLGGAAHFGPKGVEQ